MECFFAIYQIFEEFMWEKFFDFDLQNAGRVLCLGIQIVGIFLMVKMKIELDKNNK